ncbi:MBL fold metallo-hydrolase [Desulfatiglans anilini]|uniref:MBL fold metallo-hydrolase n=1 Tax=Desulfatiglans anilini TaxID=90728 RepID=UPI00048605B4|nr:MBL fold metallo-hydrolase [Desulfatiglans anilini]
MTMHRSIRSVDRIEVLTLADNYVDLLLQSDARVQRPPLARNGSIPSDTLLAEHGLSLLITLEANGSTHTLLMDAGYTRISVLHNLSILGLTLEAVEAVVLSHGHMDHTGGLYPLLATLPNRVPLVVHPDAFLERRYLQLPDGRRLLFPQRIDRAELARRGVDLRETKEPSLLCDDHLLVTGEVERVTAFENGLPGAMVERNGAVEPDPIRDDQALVMHLKDRGLVVIAGCSHAGIVNTILYARTVTGMERIHAVLGGFHLTGPYFEQVIPPTIEALQSMDCALIAPMHCTGWKAIGAFEKAFPEAFVLNSVGSRITIT